MKKKMITKMTAVLVTAAMLAACGGNSKSAESTTAGKPAESSTTGVDVSAEQKGEADTTQEAEGEGESTGGTLYDGLMNLEGYPIVNEPITLTIGYTADATYGDWNTMEWFDELEEVSGIHLEFIEYADSNAVNLMYASRNYPDITFNAGSDRQIADAAEAGDVYILDDYLDYAPNWKSYFAENPHMKARITYPDGHIYSLPSTNDRAIYELRDMWLIQGTWLDELGLQVPTTIDEFYEVLKAFKANAGTGSIPENVTPYYIKGVMNSIGGALDLIGSYGIRVMAESTYATIDDNGKVEFNYANPEIKEPLKFIHKLIEEGLIGTDGFTDDNPTYYSKTYAAEEPISGVYHAFRSSWSGEKVMGPLDTGNGKTGYIRSQSGTTIRNRFTVFKNCEYPEIAMRFANLIAEEYYTLEDVLGPFGDSLVDNGDGTYTSIEPHFLNYNPFNYAPMLMTRELSERIEYVGKTDDVERAAAIENYSDSMISKKNMYPGFIFSDANRDRISELQLDIKKHINTTINGWAINGGIDEEWDAYIAQLNGLGLEEYLSLLQEEYDRYVVNMQ